MVLSTSRTVLNRVQKLPNYTFCQKLSIGPIGPIGPIGEANCGKFNGWGAPAAAAGDDEEGTGATPPIVLAPVVARASCLAWGFEAGTKMSTFAHRGHRGAPSHALGTHRHQSRFHRHFRGTFGHFRGNFSDFQGQKPENRGKSHMIWISRK